MLSMSCLFKTNNFTLSNNFHIGNRLISYLPGKRHEKRSAYILSGQ